VDSTDKGTVGTTCTGTVSGACRIIDLDFDGDYDSTDATKFDALASGLVRHPGRAASNVEQSFAHQGLYLDPEIGSYQNRARQYDAVRRRFAQPDPLRVLLVSSMSIVIPPLSWYDETVHGRVYGYEKSEPLNHQDPSGLACSYNEDDQVFQCQFGLGKPGNRCGVIYNTELAACAGTGLVCWILIVDLIPGDEFLCAGLTGVCWLQAKLTCWSCCANFGPCPQETRGF